MNAPPPPAHDFARHVRTIVHAIPPGRVLTYGDVATLCGSPRAARAVGRALRSSLHDELLPWHRVINARGAISIRGDHGRALLQIHRLRNEGVACTDDGLLPNFPAVRWPLDSARHLARYLDLPLHD
ncbi:MAG: methylated-DNA--[protein]-cysteine S-methyltransferase [Deltaproteobacteria bacterium]|nr:MAG: methylated-DNA--[protein]-cysteine S-methyltransferase [Deltaproteobacteria bacterium]